MLAIRMQRKGRRGHAQFRLVVQDSRFSPTSGRVVAYLGSYNPHTKAAALDGETISSYLQNGARPSDRVARLLQKEGIKLPSWVKLSENKTRSTRRPEKYGSTTTAAEKPAEEASDVEAAEPAPVEEAPAVETVESAPAEETPAETEAPAAEAEKVKE
jgi:small subunit ribosomal protein S16